MYEVRFYKGNYRWRQIQANRDKCIAYIEQHFNAAGNSTVGYAVTIVGYNSSGTSKAWGRWYANHIGQEFSVPVAGRGGIAIGGFNGRGNGNVKHTNMPAILLEPLFVSNPSQAEIVRSEEGQARLAKVLADSIVEFFPKGGKIAFSVGHKYKTSRPRDRGAAVNGGGTEADYAEIVLEKAKYILENYQDVPVVPVMENEDVVDNKIRVIKDGKEIWANSDLDEDDEIIWDAENSTLYLNSK
ncbi:MAG: N-acetylmuramoyl-L-alanine amidase [Candidatus Marithrix sp.]|nr:N-acetylmuramoyl-L-alanine amidase [Candidatus Marithrix sp.]